MSDLDRARERLKQAQAAVARHPYRRSAQAELRLAREHLVRVQQEAEAEGQQLALFEEER
jgi:hypothetical protein